MMGSHPTFGVNPSSGRNGEHCRAIGNFWHVCCIIDCHFSFVSSLFCLSSLSYQFQWITFHFGFLGKLAYGESKQYISCDSDFLSLHFCLFGKWMCRGRLFLQRLEWQFCFIFLSLVLLEKLERGIPDFLSNVRYTLQQFAFGRDGIGLI